MRVVTIGVMVSIIKRFLYWAFVINAPTSLAQPTWAITTDEFTTINFFWNASAPLAFSNKIYHLKFCEKVTTDVSDFRYQSVTYG
jgi:hypothetical protein